MYLSPENQHTKTSTHAPFRTFFLGFLAVLVVVLAVPSFGVFNSEEKHSPTASAWGMQIFCGDGLGSRMDSQMSWTSPLGSTYPADSSGGRRLTAQEAFGWNAMFVAYQGESKDGESDEWTREESRANNKTVDVAADNDDGNSGKDATERIYDERTWSVCAFGSLLTQTANQLMAGAQIISGEVSEFTSFAFSTNFVCENAGAPNQGNCVDLLFIVGGSGQAGDSGGLIGALTQSIYVPLIVLVAMLVGIWTFWQGIVQRKLREALWGVLWAVVAVVLGLTFLWNPALLAQAPAKASNVLAGCVISAFGGDNCAGGSPANPNSQNGSDQICVASSSTAAADERMQLIATSLSCSIWKAFVLEPYSQASFGTNFNNLGTGPGDGATQGKQLVKGAKLENTDFCVDLQTTKRLDDMYGKTLELDGGQRVCNIALYQLYLQTNAVASADGGYEALSSGSRDVDARWYKIVDVAATNETTWNTWAAGDKGATTKLATAAIALLTSILGGLVLMVVAIFAVLFYLASIFLMALAPLFFLIGVHPGKGRDILKGWFEMVLSSVLKYLASALFLIISLALYGAVLGASTSGGMTLLFVIVLSLALFMYRRELVDLIGTANMGGTQVGKSVTDKIGQKIGFNKNSDLSRMALTTAGSAIGAKAAGGGAMAGAAEGFSRELKREGGLLGRTGSGLAMGRDFASRDNTKKLKTEESALRSATNEAEAASTEADRELKTAKSDLTQSTDKLNALNEAIDKLVKEVAEARTPQDVLGEMSARGGFDARFAEAMSIQGDIFNTNKAIQDREAAGLDASDLKAERTDLISRRDNISAELHEAGQFDRLKADYEAQTADYTTSARKLNEAVAARDGMAGDLGGKQDAALAARDKAVEADAAARVARARQQGAEETFASVRAGAATTGKVMSEVRAAGDARAAEALDPTGKEAERRAITESLPTVPAVKPVDKIDIVGTENIAVASSDQAIPGLEVSDSHRPDSNTGVASGAGAPTLGSVQDELFSAAPAAPIAPQPQEPTRPAASSGLPVSPGAGNQANEARSAAEDFARKEQEQAQQAHKETLARIETEGAQAIADDSKAAVERAKAKRETAMRDFDRYEKEELGYMKAGNEAHSEDEGYKAEMKQRQDASAQKRLEAQNQLFEFERQEKQAQAAFDTAMRSKFDEDSRQYQANTEKQISELGAAAVARAEAQKAEVLAREQQRIENTIRETKNAIQDQQEAAARTADEQARAAAARSVEVHENTLKTLTDKLQDTWNKRRNAEQAADKAKNVERQPKLPEDNSANPFLDNDSADGELFD